MISSSHHCLVLLKLAHVTGHFQELALHSFMKLEKPHRKQSGVGT